MRDSDIWAFRSVGLNLSGIGDDQHLLFKNVDIDVSHTYESYATGAGATMFMANRLHRARFDGCTFNTGSNSTNNSIGFAGWADGWGTNPDHAWNNCFYNDFTGSTITGYISHDGVHVPATKEGYWDGGVDPSNILPTAVRLRCSRMETQSPRRAPRQRAPHGGARRLSLGSSARISPIGARSTSNRSTTPAPATRGRRSLIRRSSPTSSDRAPPSAEGLPARCLGEKFRSWRASIDPRRPLTYWGTTFNAGRRAGGAGDRHGRRPGCVSVAPRSPRCRRTLEPRLSP